MQPALKIGRCFQRSRGKRRVVLQRFEQGFRRWRKTEASLGLAAAQTQHRRKQFAREKCRAALGQFGVNNFTAIRQTYYLAPHVSDPSVCVFVTEISNSNVWDADLETGLLRVVRNRSEKGKDIGVISKLLGHANPTITQNIYVHWRDEQIHQASLEVEVCGKMSQKSAKSGK